MALDLFAFLVWVVFVFGFWCGESDVFGSVIMDPMFCSVGVSVGAC